MCYCDYDPPQFFNRNFVKGRKQHKCVECLRVIEVGEMQELVSGKWEGDFETFRTCMQCVELREAMQLECYAYGMLVDDVSQADPFTDQMQEFRDRRDKNYRRIQDEKRQMANA